MPFDIKPDVPPLKQPQQEKDDLPDIGKTAPAPFFDRKLILTIVVVVAFSIVLYAAINFFNKITGTINFSGGN